MKTLLVPRHAIVGSRCLISLITSFAIGTVQAQNRILFVGNSFTLGWSEGMAQMVGGVPEIFDAMARAGGHTDPETVMRAVAGMDFEFHVTDLATQRAITSQQWTHVVLQNRSADPTHLAKGSISDHHTYGAQLYNQVIESNAATQVILYETFSRSEAHPLITGVSSPYSFASTGEFHEEVSANYAELAESLTAANPGNRPVQVAPVGSAWKRAGGLLPADAEGFVDLYSRDEYHGNDNGYYLAAAVFYATIYRESPEGLSVSVEVQALNLVLTEDAAALERVAWETVDSKNMLVAGHVLLLDFGATVGRRAAVDDPNTWNIVTPAVGASKGGSLTSLLASTGSETDMNLTMIEGFSGVDVTGTTGHPNWPATATGDSLMGSNASFGGNDHLVPSFKLSNLNRALEYTFTMFASRMGDSGSRETGYTIAGDRELSGVLEPSNNKVDTVAIGPVWPDVDGSVTVSVEPIETDSSGNRFSYLGIMQIDVASAKRGRPFEITAIERSADGITLTWESTVNVIYMIESSRDLEKWNRLKEGIASAGRTTAYTVTPSTDELISFYRVNGR